MLRIYSGGKGFHLWWASRRAQRLTLTERRALMHVVLAPPPPSDVIPLPPHTLNIWQTLAVDAMLEIWEERAIRQRMLLLNAATHDTVLVRYLSEFVPPGNVWPLTSPTATSVAQWRAWKRVAGKQAAQCFVYELGWPILDAPVTLEKGHTVKTPYAIHATTGRVALPLARMEDCRPEWMPTVANIITPQTDERGIYQKHMWDMGLQCLDTWLKDTAAGDKTK